MGLARSFAGRLLRARADRGWSQADLAAASGVAATQISRYEAGSIPRAPVVAKLAKALGEPFEWLLTGEDPGLKQLDDDGLVEINIRSDLHEQLRLRAERDGLPLEDLMIKLLEESMKSHGPNGGSGPEKHQDQPKPTKKRGK